MFVLKKTDRDRRPRSRRSPLKLPAALVIAVALLLALSVAANAKPLPAAVAAAPGWTGSDVSALTQSSDPEFTNWTSSSGNTARGTLRGQPISLSGSHVTEVGITLDGTSTVFAESYFTPPLPRSDAIEFRGHWDGYSYVLTFGSPTKDPVVHFASLASTLRFPAGTSITRVSGENGSFSVDVSGSTVVGTPDGPNDSNGTVRLNGVFTSISFSAQTPGYLDGIYIQVGAPAASGSADNCPDADLMPTRSTDPDSRVRARQDVHTRVRAENAIICLTNYERTSRGLPALGSDSALGQAALGHSEDMAQRDYFRHCSYGLSGPEPKPCPRGFDDNGVGYGPIDRVQNAGYRGVYRNENISWGTGSSSTPRSVVQRWMASTAGHREAILRPESNQIGVGVSLFAPTTYTGQAATYTQVFGSLG